MNILVVNNHTLHLHEIHTLFSPTDRLTYISYSQIGGYELNDFDCVVLTGSSSHTYMNKAFVKEIVLIKEIQKPLIGICLGCELIAEAFGGIVAKENERIEGDIKVICEDKTYTVHEAHRFSLIGLSEELEGLVKSDYGYEVVQHKNKPILGFQFHPEVISSSRDGYDLFVKYIKKILS